MLAHTAYRWQRFWCPSDGAYSLANSGYLMDPRAPYSRYYQRRVVPFADLEGIPCLALLGEAGSGKSTTVAQERALTEAAAGAEQVISLDLRAYGDAARLERAIFETEKFLAWRRGDGLLHLFLDSLDEYALQQPYVASLLLERLRALGDDLPRLRLRIACRTVAWPRQFDAGFPLLWGPQGFGRYELLPLREVDVEEACRAEGLDAPCFLHAVARIEAQPLASRPITLRPLLDAFRDDQNLPPTRAAAFLRGSLLLADEPSDSRRDARRAGKLRAEERVAIAARIAAVLVLCRRTFVAPEAPLDPLDLDRDALAAGMLPAAAIEGGTELVGDRQVVVDRETLDEVLASGLFSDGRAFAHQSFAEFLAARYLLAHHLPAATLLRLVAEESGKVIPQLTELSAWLAEMHPDVRRRLVDTDPQALLRSDLGAAGAAEKSALTASLLRGFANGELADLDWALPRDYPKLRHSGLAAQLGPYVADRTIDPMARRFAIELALRCEVRELQDLLASLALDGTETPSIRNSAAQAVAGVGADSTTLRRLLPLAAGGGDDDPDDQLKGHALAALWPGELTIDQLLPSLSRPRSKLLGSYRRFLGFAAAQNLGLEDFPAALAWAGRQEVAGDRHGLGELVDELWLAAARHLDAPTVRSALAAALSSAMLMRHQLFLDSDKEREFTRRVQESPARRPLAQLLVAAMTDSARQGSNILWWGLLGPADLDWAMERLRAAGETPEANHWAALIRQLCRLDNAAHVDAVLREARNPALARAFVGLLGAIELGSDEAMRQQQWYEHSQPRPRPAPPPTRSLPLSRLTGLLDQIDSGNLAAFQGLAANLADERLRGDLETDIATEPMWAALDDSMHQRILAAARRFLRERGPATTAWLTANTIRAEAMAAYRALRLLTLTEPDWLAGQREDFWRKWAALVVRFPIESGTEHENPDLRLTALAFRGAPAAALAALLREVDQQAKGDHLFVLRKLRDCWPEGRLGRALLARAKRGGFRPEPFHQLLRELVQRELSGAAAHAVRMISSPAPGDRDAQALAATAAAVLLTGPWPSGWDRAWRAVAADSAFGRQVIGEVARREHDEPIAALGVAWPEDRIADLFLWMVREFPPEEDPRLDGIVTERHAVADLRRKLLALLKLRGTATACGALRRIETQLPRYPMLRLERLEAEKHALRAAWIPLSPSDVLRLGRQPGTPVVQSSEQLLEAVSASLGKLQDRLQGSPTTTYRLWNETARCRWRPKDESTLADEVVVHLQDDLRPEGFVALREVQISRGVLALGGRRRGKRTDILVIGVVRDEATHQARQLQVIIEVKGSWHPDLAGLMRKQLVDRYLDRTGCRHGVYLVGWYHCDLWDSTDRRRRQFRGTTREALVQNLEAEARRLSDGRAVRAMVLDVSLGAPEGPAAAVPMVMECDPAKRVTGCGS